MTDQASERCDAPGRYEIRLKGHLADRWGSWFDGFTLTRAADGSTVLAGVAVDQAALHGVLRRIADLGVPLISVMPATSRASMPRPADPS